MAGRSSMRFPLIQLMLLSGVVSAVIGYSKGRQPWELIKTFSLSNKPALKRPIRSEISPDKSRVIVISMWGMQLLDAADGKVLYEESRTIYPDRIYFRSNGRIVHVARLDSIDYLDAATGKPLAENPSDEPPTVETSRYLAAKHGRRAVLFERGVDISDAESGTQLFFLIPEGKEELTAVNFSEDGEELLVSREWSVLWYRRIFPERWYGVFFRGDMLPGLICLFALIGMAARSEWRYWRARQAGAV